MEALCEQLRRNDPSVKRCTINVFGGDVQILLEALQANSSVEELKITFEWNRTLHRRNSADAMISFITDLKEFLKTTAYVKKVTFGYMSQDFFGIRDRLFLDLLDHVTENPIVAALSCDDNKIPTNELTKILSLQSLRRLSLKLHAELNSQVVADAFGANNTLEFLNLLGTDDLSVVEAVLPRLGEIPSLSELKVFGGRMPRRGLPSPSTPMNTVTFVSSVQRMLVTSSSLTKLSLFAFVFSKENITVLISGLKENQSISVLRLRCCWFENDGCSETFAAFMKSINVTNPNLQRLDIFGCEIKGYQYAAGPFLPPMLVQAPLRVLGMGNHVGALCNEWVRNPDRVQLRGLILRAFDDRSEWKALVESLPHMKSIRELTITELGRPSALLVQHMQNHWNLQKLVLRRDGRDVLTEQEHRLVDAYGMRNKHVPSMLSHPVIPGANENVNDRCGDAKERRLNYNVGGTITLSLFPTLFQTALRTKSKSPHILLLGLLSASYAIGGPAAGCDRKRASM